MSLKLKALGLALIASLAMTAIAASSAAGFYPAHQFTPSTGEAALVLGLLATSLLAAYTGGMPRGGLTVTTQRPQLSDDREKHLLPIGPAVHNQSRAHLLVHELANTIARRDVQSDTDQGEAQRGIRHPAMSRAGTH